jgi:hypothetical protein
MHVQRGHDAAEGVVLRGERVAQQRREVRHDGAGVAAIRWHDSEAIVRRQGGVFMRLTSMQHQRNAAGERERHVHHADRICSSVVSTRRALLHQQRLVLRVQLRAKLRVGTETCR